MMQIFIKTLSNKTITLDVDCDDTVQDIKKQIQHLQNIPVKQQRLHFGGKLLQNVTLSNYKIYNLSVLNLSVSTTLSSPNTSIKQDIYSLLPLIKTLHDTTHIYECNPSATIASIFKELGQLVVEFTNHSAVYIVPDNTTHEEIELTNKQIYTERVFMLHHSIRHGAAMKVLLYNNKIYKLVKLACREFIFIFTNNEVKIAQPARLKVMGAIGQCIGRLKPNKNNKFSLCELSRCLELFMRNSSHSEIIKEDSNIVPSILKILSYGNVDNDAQITQWHDTLLRCLMRYGGADILLKHDILHKLDFLVDPCQNKGNLRIFSILITSQLCRSSQILQTPNFPMPVDILFRDDSDVIGGKNWFILKHLNTLLLYEDDTKIIQYALDGLRALINKAANLEEDIDVIVSNLYMAQTKAKYVKKRHENRFLFDGFIQTVIKESNIKFIPYDIVWSIFNYYNCYETIETDLLRRLINLFDKSNGYPMGVRNSAFSALQRITQFCYPKLSMELMNNYNILNEMKKFLIHDCNFSYLDEICWLLSNLSSDNVRLVLKSDIIESTVHSFTKMAENRGYNCVGNVIFPLVNIIQTINEDERINSVVKKYEFVAHLTLLMKAMCEDEMTGLSYTDSQLWEKVFDILEFLLVVDHNRDICIEQMKKKCGMKILDKIKNRQSTHMNIQQTVSNRAISLLADYFQNS